MTISEERVAHTVGGLERPKASPAAIAGMSISSILLVLAVSVLGAVLQGRVDERGGNIVLGGAFIAFASVVIGIAVGYALAVVIGPRARMADTPHKSSASANTWLECRLAAAREAAALGNLVQDGGERTELGADELYLIRRQCVSLARFLQSDTHLEERLRWVVDTLQSFPDKLSPSPDGTWDRRTVARQLQYVAQALDSAATCGRA